MSANAPSIVLFDAQLKEERQFWIDRVSGALERPDSWLDGDRALPPPDEGLEICSFALPAQALEALERLTKGSPFLTFTVLVAAAAVCLRRYLGQDTVVLGSPALAELERANALPIVVRMDGAMTFKQLLMTVRAALLEAYDRQRYPANYLLRDLGLDPAGGAGLFDVALGLDGLHGHLPPLDLTLAARFTHGDGGIAGRLTFHPGRLRRERAEAFAGHLAAALSGGLASPEGRIDALDLLAEEERRLLLAAGHGAAADYPPEATLHGLFEAQARRTPDAVALIFEDETLSYAELDARAGRLARALRRAGAGPEVPVGVFLERSVELVVTLLAVLKAGGAYLPLDPEHPPARVAALLAEAAPPVVVTGERLRGRLQELRPAPELRVVVADADVPADEADTLPPAAVAAEVGPDNLAYILHTSGSTGQPQGAMNTHRAICNRLLWMQDAYRLRPGDRVLQKTPFSFDVSVWEFFWPLAVGACLVEALPGGHRDSSYLLRVIAGRGIHVVHFVPSMLEVFLEEDGVEEAGRTLGQVICSGEALTPELRRRFLERLGCELHNLYGPTEAAIDVTSWDCHQPLPNRTVPIGRPIANLRIHLADRDSMPVPAGVPGELCIGGVGLARGYLGRPDRTAARFVPDPFSGLAGERLYRTGDLARQQPNGVLEYLGRLDHQVKIRGFRVELGEVEAILRRHPAVREAVVVVRPDSRGEPRLVAYAVPPAAALEALPAAGPGESAEDAAVAVGRLREDLAAQLRAFVSEALPEPMVPASFVLLEALPLNANGKVDRRALPDPAAERSRPHLPPRTPMEEELAGLWCELLRLDRVSIDDNFFTLGGHSLLLTQLASRIRKAFRVDLPLRLLFDVPTVERMATAIVEKQMETAEADELADMMRRLESLSPDEIEALLRAEER